MDDHRQTHLVYCRTSLRNPAHHAANIDNEKKSHPARSTQRPRRNGRPPKEAGRSQEFARLLGLIQSPGRNARLPRANARRDRNRFPFHRRLAITDGGAFEKIFAQERKDSAESFVLRGMHKLMNNERSISPAIGANENTVLQCETSRSRCEKTNRRLCDL